jgi:type IV pilus assembly protein PilA
MRHADRGFTLVELMVVVLILGILVAIAIPVYNAAKAKAQQAACYQNERTIEGAAQLYEGAHPGASKADLAGQLNSTNLLVTDNFLARPPFCPAATDPTVNGLYTLDASGSVLNCPWGSPVHGHF